MIIQLSGSKFILTGTGCRITFRPMGKDAGKLAYLKVEEGTFVNGQFHASRILNGDETDWGGPFLEMLRQYCKLRYRGGRTIYMNTRCIETVQLQAASNDLHHWF